MGEEVGAGLGGGSKQVLVSEEKEQPESTHFRRCPKKMEHVSGLGAEVPSGVGLRVGDTVGTAVGKAVGAVVGAIVAVGLPVRVGDALGVEDGLVVGDAVGGNTT